MQTEMTHPEKYQKDKLVHRPNIRLTHYFQDYEGLPS